MRATELYEGSYIQYIMGVPLGDLVDPENYYHRSQNSLYSWFVDLPVSWADLPTTRLPVRTRRLGLLANPPNSTQSTRCKIVLIVVLLVRMVDMHMATASFSGARKIQIFDSACNYWKFLQCWSHWTTHVLSLNQCTDSAVVRVRELACYTLTTIALPPT